MKRLLMLSVLSLGLAFAGAAQAAVLGASTLSVSANVQTTCTVTTTPVNFGNVTPGGYMAYTAEGDVTVNCPSTTPYKISLDAGQRYSLSDGLRSLSGVNNLPYALFTDAGYTTEWGDSDYANTYPNGASFADTGIGANQLHTVFGVLDASTAISGAYSDVVGVTVQY